MTRLTNSRAFPLALMGVGLFLLALGVMRREHFTVLRKAAMICLECIGIG